MQKPHILVLLRVRSASSAPCKMPSGQALPFQRNILCNKTKGTQETNQVESFSMEPKCKTLTATVKDLHNHLRCAMGFPSCSETSSSILSSNSLHFWNDAFILVARRSVKYMAAAATLFHWPECWFSMKTQKNEQTQTHTKPHWKAFKIEALD